MKKQSNKRSAKSNTSRVNKRSDRFGDNKRSTKLREDDQVCNSSNDVAWYSNSPTILGNVARIPFYRRTGDVLKLNDPVVSWSTTNQSPNITVPGLITAHVIPSLGFGSDATSPLNLAATNVYTYVRHQNSGHANYERSDLLLMIAGATSVFAYVNYLMRIYGTMTMYSPFNKYMPHTLISAMGADFNDIHKNYADFRYGINLLIRKASNILTPASMPIFQRQAFMYRDIYTDGASVKDQMYMFVPEAFLRFSHDPSSQAGILVYDKFDCTQSRTVKDLIDYGHVLIDALLDEEDIGIMCGDILKAYQSNVNTLTYMPDDYTVIPKFDPVVLEQFKNSRTICVDGVDAFNFDTSGIYQSNNLLLTRYYVGIDRTTLKKAAAKNFGLLLGSNKAVSTKSPEATPELIMEMSRLISTVSDIVDMENEWRVILKPASEMVTHYSMYKILESGSLRITNYSTYHTTSSNWSNIIQTMSDFEYSPEYRLYNLQNVTDNSYAVSDYVSIFNKDNYTMLTTDEIDNLNQVAILSLLNVNGIGLA